MLLDDNRRTVTRVLKARLAVLAIPLVALVLVLTKAPGLLVFAEPLRPVAQAGDITVTVPVLVTDSRDRYVSGLERYHFSVREDGVDQTISDFLPAQQESVSVVIVVNGNGAPSDGFVQQAVSRFLAADPNPGDEFALIRFTPAPELATGFTTDIDQVLNRLPASTFAPQFLLDGVVMAPEQFRLARNLRRVVVVFSEGGPGATAYTEEELRIMAAAVDSPIYSTSVARQGPSSAMLDNLARYTGGRHYPVEPANAASDVGVKLAVAIRNFYVVTFQSQNRIRDGSYRSIEVELIAPRGLPRLLTFNRTGYLAPTQMGN